MEMLKLLAATAACFTLAAAPLAAQDDTSHSQVTACSEAQTTPCQDQSGDKEAQPDPVTTKSNREPAEGTASGSPGNHIFGVLPNYATVWHTTAIAPVSAH
jgi:hypothetical protein